MVYTNVASFKKLVYGDVKVGMTSQTISLTMLSYLETSRTAEKIIIQYENNTLPSMP